MKHRILLLLALLTALLATGCGERTEKKITFSDSGIESDVIGVSIEGTTLTIRTAGTYTLTGSCSEGNIIIDAPAGQPVILILNNLNLTCSTTSPIIAKDCPMVSLVIASRSQNIITDRHAYSELLSQDGEAKDAAAFEDVPNAAIYSRCPLQIRAEGEGNLVINAESYNGISSSDTLTITGGVINVTSKNNALRGKDYVVISGGVLTLKAGNDGIKATNTEKASLGYIHIRGGILNIQADDEAMYAPRSVSFDGGTVTIKSKNTGIKTEGTVEFDSGIITVTSNDEPVLCGTQTKKDTALVTLNGAELK